MLKLYNWVPIIVIIIFGVGCLDEVGSTLSKKDIILVDSSASLKYFIDSSASSKYFIDSSSSSEYFIDSYQFFPKQKLQWQGCPTIGIDDKGNLFCAWMTGGRTEEPGNYITMSTSSTNGISWHPNRLIISPISNKSRDIDPIFWSDKFNNLHLSWVFSNGMWDGGDGGVWDITLDDSKEGINISKPIRLFKGVMNTKPIVTSENKIFFPVFGWNFTAANSNYLWNNHPIKLTNVDINGAYIYSSVCYKDSLSTPIRHSTLKTLNNKRWADEHMIVELNQSHFLSILRSFDGILFSESFDGCKSWSVPKPMNQVGETVESKSFLRKLASGKLLLIYNNSKKRSNLTASLSVDEGKTWPYKLLIDNRSNVSYPDAIQTLDGKIHIVYDRERTTAKEIIHVVIEESDIIKGAANIKKNIVSK